MVNVNGPTTVLYLFLYQNVTVIPSQRYRYHHTAGDAWENAIITNA